MTSLRPDVVARRLWDVMATNDFAAVTELLADGFELVYPQSGERFDAAVSHQGRAFPRDHRSGTVES